MRAFLIASALLVSACASQIMEGYVGRDITDAILDYGPPAYAMDMPDGTKAFQWKMTSSGVTPAYTTLNTNYYGNSAFTTATTSGGIPYTSTCVYTLFGTKNANSSYTITGFKKPNLMCE